MLSRRTMPLSAAGIAVIFAIAVWQYGIFHLADYPVFLGIAAYLALVGLQRDLFGIRPIDVVRWTAGITLMWASIEKWAYPEWSYPLLVEHPDMAMGFDPDFFMRAAGAVEFALAFAIDVDAAGAARSAAVMLAAMFISAVFDFGKVDLIGHTLIVVVLLAIIADNRARSTVAAAPVAGPGRLRLRARRVSDAIYYVAHAAAVRHVDHLTRKSLRTGRGPAESYWT